MSLTSQELPAPRKLFWKRLSIVAGGLTVLALCLTIRHFWGPKAANAKGPLETAAQKAPAAAARPNPATQGGQSKPQVVAIVNGEEISRNDLARYCLWHYGKSVLESVVNKRLIVERCRELKMQVTQQEVDAEIERVARKFSLPVEQWLKMLQTERNVTPQQYAQEIIWPTLALRKLAAQQLQVSPEELAKAKETYYGPAVKARMIACKDKQRAGEVHAKALANPDDFGNLAKEFSEDLNTASTLGRIQPIRRHVGDPQIEQVAFRMQPGEVSQVIPAGGQFIILKCEEVLPPSNPPKNYEQALTETIREGKLREAASQLFKELQDRASVQIVFNDEELSRKMPGVAAVVNQTKITTLELAEECISRHGVEVSNGLVSRRVLEQACKKRSITVTEQDENEEIGRAAVAMGKVDAQGRPDIAGWLKAVKEEQGIDEDIYVHDAVWPSVALKKMVVGTVKVSEEDIKKGFEANYGPRVRCLAIVLNSQRLAQEVWEKARATNTSQFFGDLAEQYSVEASSRALRGEVKPIQRHGGQPGLEQEAFNLKPGELSGIVQVADKFVILRCEGFTEPVKVNFDEVKPMIYEDLLEKKLRVAMSQEYDRLMETAQIDNYLAGTSQSGRKPEGLRSSSALPKLQQLPEARPSSSALPARR
jgi:parvulin-like peptidyl-prolyl isomerase